jgi:hypothetical protein
MDHLGAAGVQFYPAKADMFEMAGNCGALVGKVLHRLELTIYIKNILEERGVNTSKIKMKYWDSLVSEAAGKFGLQRHMERNILQEFVETAFVKEAGREVSAADIWTAWSQIPGSDRMKRQRFATEFAIGIQNKFEAKRVRRRQPRGEKAIYWSGIRFKVEQAPKPIDPPPEAQQAPAHPFFVKPTE